MMFERTAFSRMRSESAALINPRPVHENAATTITSASPGTAESGMSTLRISEPAVSENAETNAQMVAINVRLGFRPVEDHRQRAAEEERNAAGRADEDRAQRVLVALASDHLRHREEAGDGRVLDRVADHVELVRLEARGPADVREEQDLEDRRHEQARDVDLRRQPVEEGPVRHLPAVEEDA